MKNKIKKKEVEKKKVISLCYAVAACVVKYTLT